MNFSIFQIFDFNGKKIGSSCKPILTKKWISWPRLLIKAVFRAFSLWHFDIILIRTLRTFRFGINGRLLYIDYDVSWTSLLEAFGKYTQKKSHKDVDEVLKFALVMFGCWWRWSGCLDIYFVLRSISASMLYRMQMKEWMLST